jgi:hypothetical protein
VRRPPFSKECWFVFGIRGPDIHLVACAMGSAGYPAPENFPYGLFFKRKLLI